MTHLDSIAIIFSRFVKIVRLVGTLPLANPAIDAPVVIPYNLVSPDK